MSNLKLITAKDFKYVQHKYIGQSPLVGNKIEKAKPLDVLVLDTEMKKGGIYIKNVDILNENKLDTFFRILLTGKVGKEADIDFMANDNFAPIDRVNYMNQKVERKIKQVFAELEKILKNKCESISDGYDSGYNCKQLDNFIKELKQKFAGEKRCH